jgi:lactoylglutathione lyase
VSEPSSDDGAPRCAGAVHHVAVNVSDLERSLRFYAGALGLRTTLRMEIAGEPFERLLRLPTGASGRVAYVEGGARIGQIELIEWRLPAPPETTPAGPPDAGSALPGPRLLSFSVSEPLEQWHARLQRHGVKCWSAPISLELPNYGLIRAMVAEDPDGYLVELVNLPSDEEVREFRRRGSN